MKKIKNKKSKYIYVYLPTVGTSAMHTLLIALATLKKSKLFTLPHNQRGITQCIE